MPRCLFEIVPSLLSDIVFALALSMIVSASDAPKTFSDLEGFLLSIIPVSAAFLILIAFWHSHVTFFRRFGIADRTIISLDTNEKATLNIFQNLPIEHKVKISSDSEPGEKLWLCLTFVNKENQSPVSNQEVHFYHTSTNGEYLPSDPDDESTARLNGSAITNNSGQIFVQTILPGDYGSSPDNRHIHMTVKGAKPEAYDIHFKQYTGYMGSNFISSSDQHFLADLKKKNTGILVSFLPIEVKNPKSSLSVQ